MGANRPKDVAAAEATLLRYGFITDGQEIKESGACNEVVNAYYVDGMRRGLANSLSHALASSGCIGLKSITARGPERRGAPQKRQDCSHLCQVLRRMRSGASNGDLGNDIGIVFAYFDNAPNSRARIIDDLYGLAAKADPSVNKQARVAFVYLALKDRRTLDVLKDLDGKRRTRVERLLRSINPNQLVFNQNSGEWYFQGRSAVAAREVSEILFA